MKALATGRLIRGKDKTWIARIHLADGREVTRVAPSSYTGRRVLRCVTREAMRISAYWAR